MKSLSFLSLMILIVSIQNIHAQERENILDKSKWRFMENIGEYGNIELRDDEILTFTTEKQPPFIYNLSSTVRLKNQDLKQGQVVLIQYDARTMSSSFETGEAKLHWVLKQGDTHKDNLQKTLSISSEWQTYYAPLLLTRNVSKDDLRLSIQYGFRPQVFNLKNVHIFIYPDGTDLNELPKTRITYAGMDPNAFWRKVALQRIENIRKTNFSIQLMRDGKPISNQLLNVKLTKHDFGWGAALNAEDVVNQTDRYKKYKSAFSLAVLENDLKIKSWENKTQRARTLRAIDILNEDGIDIKGHVLIWPGFQYLTKKIRKNKDNPGKVKEIIDNHVKDIVQSTKGKISRWDVVNEAYTNQDLQDITGSEEILYDAFRTLDKLDRKPLKLLNEYGIISKGGIDHQKQNWYKEFAMRVDSATGGMLDGIGIQSHMGSDLTSPEKVLEILDFYASLGKKISISEFTMEIDDPEVRAMYTRDFIIAAFSHPSVYEFLFWGYDTKKNNKVDVFTETGLGSMGEMYFALVHDIWKTVFNATTSSNGMIEGRGFYGEYEYSYIADNKVVTGIFEVLPDQSDDPIVIQVH